MDPKDSNSLWLGGKKKGRKAGKKGTGKRRWQICCLPVACWRGRKLAASESISPEGGRRNTIKRRREGGNDEEDCYWIAPETYFDDYNGQEG